MKASLYFSAAAAGVLASADGLLAAASPGALPSIKLGSLSVSRLILGSNAFFGWDHGNPQGNGNEMRAYYTDDRIMAVLDAAAEQGITAVWSPCYDRWVAVWNKYQEHGGKLKIWIGQPDAKGELMPKHIEVAAKNGAKAICIQGIRVDEQMESNHVDVVRAWLDQIKSYGLPAGIATHRARTHFVAEEKGLPTDFYHQTLYRPDDYVKEGLEESLATIEKLEKPVVAYKALGAGRIAPSQALPYIFRRLKAKDGVCIGAFPRKKDELAENATLVRRLSQKPTA